MAKMLGERLKETRVKRNMSILDVAKTTHLTMMSLEYIEDGIPPTKEEAEKINDFLVDREEARKQVELMKKKRIKEGLSKAALGRMFGWKINKVSELENGRVPKVKELNMIRKYLNKDAP